MTHDFNWHAILPEILLLSIALIAQLLSLFFKISSQNLVKVVSCLVVLILVSIVNSKIGWDGCSYDTSQFAHSIKGLLLYFWIISNIFFITTQRILNTNIDLEYVSLSLLSCLGGFIAISAMDLLTLFMGIELQALVSYILTSLYKRSSNSSEAGIKYFSLGAMSSCLMLLGISFIYGFNGSISYPELTGANLSIVSQFGAVLIVLGLLFKLSAAPMHFWSPDVYQGSPVFSLSMFISVNKLAALVALINLMISVFNNMQIINVVLQIAIVASLIIGSLGALMQTNFKRFIAYSGIFNVSYVLLALVIGQYDLAIFYLVVYIINAMVILGLLLAMNIDPDSLSIADLKGLYYIDKIQTIPLGLSLLSLIGIPPFLGFVAKYYVLYTAVFNEYYYLALCASIVTVIAAYYYLRIIKTIFLEGDRPIAKVLAISSAKSLVLILFNVLGILFISFGWVAAKYIVI
jgi:NADH-quinone oxidoreductase subunit N